jgi:hypothetical protein
MVAADEDDAAVAAAGPERLSLAMGANRGRDIPDATPPFLTKEVIDGWIAMAEARIKDEIHERELAAMRQQHEFDKGQLHLISRVEKLAGDGEQDVGAVARIERQLNDYIAENRAASLRASAERHELSANVTAALGRIAALEEDAPRAKRVEDQVNRWRLIPTFTRNLWKIIAAIATLALALVSLWTFFHPQPVVLTPQQMQEIRKGH